METLTIELTNPKAKTLLDELEALNIIRVVRPEAADTPKQKLSERLRGSISPEAADAFNKYVQQSRDEWERDS